MNGATQLNLNKLFIGGLHYQTTPDDLVAYFQQFGEVEHGSIMYHHENHKSRGFGFVVFKHSSSVKKVITQTYHEIMGRRVEVKHAIPKTQFQSSESIPEFSSEFSDPSNSVPNPQFDSYYWLYSSEALIDPFEYPHTFCQVDSVDLDVYQHPYDLVTPWNRISPLPYIHNQQLSTSYQLDPMYPYYELVTHGIVPDYLSSSEPTRRRIIIP